MTKKEMKKQDSLIQGSIFKALFRLAIPIIATSFVQMAYNMTDMIWVGRVGTRAVAAVGTAGFYSWMSMAFILIPKIGAEVGVAQSVGKQNMEEAKVYIKHSLQMVVFLALFYTSILITFRKNLIGFFNINETDIVNDAITYLVIVASGMVFPFINTVFSAIFNGYGESRTPFLINSSGLVANMILDPLLILGIGPFPRMEVAGAAIATIIAQATVTTIFIIVAIRKPKLFSDLSLLKAPDFQRIKKITKLGLPVALQSGLFTTSLLLFASRPIFSLFIPEEETIRYGIIYLKILGLSQLFMCTESVTGGAFNGLGKTIPPSVTSISLNALRIPIALILSSTDLGLNGVWWDISITSIFKGTVLPVWYIIMLKRNPETKHLKISGFVFKRSTV